ncbi:Threonine/homoserine exporter RhtA [Corynebacterium oculi]|uniref:Threonine/homoserine exporter RhtA n=2 Tax=Corynebacterium oculi TaxID=1544416 RepID=A0A0Q0YT36_9CORY|nr:Threonine/homoserine exporter RhtA [Corynebacterium oculi]
MPREVFGILLSLEPAFAAVIGWLVLGQALGAGQWLAVALVISASVGTTMGSRRSRNNVYDMRGNTDSAAMKKGTGLQNNSQSTVPLVVAAIIVAGLFLLLALYLGLTRYYNAQEVEVLVEGAEANGRNYSVVIHNWLTGSYSFSIE